MSKGTENLLSHQLPLDVDGVYVSVSRHALNEVLEEHAGMLSALKQAVARADKHMAEHYGGEREPACWDDYNKCVAAIAKAEGT